MVGKRRGAQALLSQDSSWRSGCIMVLPFSEDTQASQVTQCSWRELACIQAETVWPLLYVPICPPLSCLPYPSLKLKPTPLKLLLLSPSLLYVKVTHVIM